MGTGFRTRSCANKIPSGPGEHRLALLHEGIAALDVVLATEAGLHRLVGAFHVALRLILQDFADHLLDRADGERRVARDRLGILLYVILELSARQHAIDETHRARLLGGELARRIEDLLGKRWPDDIDEALEPRIRIAETELGGRHRERRVV